MEPGTIGGRVTLPSGYPVNGRMRITISTTGNPGVTSYTDSKGEFSFRNLREGIYYIEIRGDSSLYEPVREEVRLIRAGRVYLSIALRERSDTSNKESVGIVSAAEFDQKVPSAAKKEFEKATKLVEHGKMLEAIERLKQAIFVYPDYLMARNNLGARYLKLNRLDEAVEQFKAAIEINPKAFNPNLNLGIVLIHQNKYSEAIQRLSELRSIDVSEPAGYYYLGFALLKVAQLELSEQQFRKALEFGSAEYLVAHYYLAHIHLQRGERDKAIEELRRYLKNDPHSAYAAQTRQLLERLESVK